ncbi:MAG: hypothetical protein MUC87_19315 [Bacteroidia bacterium]|jgi:hypothetical protein|nr:hypothetical protein [Bacteroidia bacterium]
MQRSKLIYELVKSLSAPEKRYVARHLKLFREETNHAELFKALDLLEEYNPQILKSKLGNSGAAKHLDVAKVQLYDICLRYLRSYHESSYTEIRLQTLLGECRLLINRGMFEHCRRRLAQIKVIAARNFVFSVLLEVNEAERELVLTAPSAEPILEALEKLENEESRLFEQYRNYRFYIWAASHAAACSLVIGSPQEKEAEEKLHALMKHELLSSENQALSLPAKRLYNYTKAFYAHAYQNYTNSILHNARHVELLESYPEHTPDTVRSLVSALYNLLIDYYASGHYEDALETILRLRTLPEKLPGKLGKATFLRQKMLIRVINMELAVLTRMGRFENECVEWDELNEALVMLDEGKEEALGIDLRFSAAHFCFGTGEYRQALRYLNTIINDAPPGSRMLMQLSAWLLRLIIYRSINESDQAYAAMLRQTRRWINEHKLTDKRQLVFIDFFEAEAGMNRNSEEWKKLATALSQKVNDPTPPNEALVFDFSAWLESVMKQKSYAEVLKEKYERIK